MNYIIYTIYIILYIIYIYIYYIYSIYIIYIISYYIILYYIILYYIMLYYIILYIVYIYYIYYIHYIILYYIHIVHILYSIYVYIIYILYIYCVYIVCYSASHAIQKSCHTNSTVVCSKSFTSPIWCLSTWTSSILLLPSCRHYWGTLPLASLRRAYVHLGVSVHQSLFTSQSEHSQVALECNTETIKVPRSWIQWSLSVPFKKGQLAHHKFLQPGRPTSVPWTNPKPSQHKISFMGARPPPKADWGPDQIPATKVARSILAEGNRTGTGEWVDVYKFCYRHYRNWANSCVQMHMHVARCDHEHVPRDKVGMCRRTHVWVWCPDESKRMPRRCMMRDATNTSVA